MMSRSMSFGHGCFLPDFLSTLVIIFHFSCDRFKVLLDGITL